MLLPHFNTAVQHSSSSSTRTYCCRTRRAQALLEATPTGAGNGDAVPRRVLLRPDPTYVLTFALPREFSDARGRQAGVFSVYKLHLTRSMVDGSA